VLPSPKIALFTHLCALAATAKILKELRERKEIEGRDSGRVLPSANSAFLDLTSTTGKQSVYHVTQVRDIRPRLQIPNANNETEYR
jgi:hypothetical protein